MNRNQIIAIIAGAFLLVVATAAASTYLANRADSKPAAQLVHKNTNNKVTWDQPKQQPATQQQVASVNCNDNNVAGKVVGGVGGGVLASNIGKGSGKTAATIGGTLGGAYLGGKYIPLNNVTCR